MNIPAHYRAFNRLFLRFAIVMVFAALLMGLVFQESAKRTPFSLVGPGIHLESILNLALVHGHVFLIGVLIPLGLTWMLYLGLAMGYPPVGEKRLRIGSWLYLPSSVITMLLMLYKGYHFDSSVRGGQMDFTAINNAYFWGNHGLRAATYGLAHLTLAVGLGVIVIGFWRTMGKGEP
jgi:hypothetical protein